MGDVVLKGGLRYQEDEDVVYIWHSSDNACEKCQALNEKTFCSIDEIPDLPHPNCKCWVEDKKKDDEECDCWKIAEKFDELIQQANSLRLELSEIVSRISGFAKSIYENICSAYLAKTSKWDNALGDFSKNYLDMVEANTIGADKYFHAKANCSAAQRGLTGEVFAVAQSFFREIEEGTRKVIFEGKDLIEQIEDVKKDMEANKEGRELGKNFKDSECSVLLEHRKVNGLNEKY